MLTHRQALLDLAAASAQLRLGYFLLASSEQDRREWIARTRPWVRQSKALEARMAHLGRAAQRDGWDVRESPFWPLLEYKESYEAAYEDGRVVALDELTPAMLYYRLKRKNRVIWCDWEIFIAQGKSTPIADRLPKWETWVHARKGNAPPNIFFGASRETSARICKTLLGYGRGVDRESGAIQHVVDM